MFPITQFAQNEQIMIGNVTLFAQKDKHKMLVFHIRFKPKGPTCSILSIKIYISTLSQMVLGDVIKRY